ncbi:MAG: hypothetical protein EOM51_10115 [Clostridia bacterium]|nr:hypothetical protein [Clostridia bacterium]
MKSNGITPSILWWFGLLSMIGMLMHINLIDSPNYTNQQELHYQIVTHSADAPYQYRILQPIIVDTLLKFSGAETTGSVYKFVFLGGYAAIRFLAIFTTFVAVFFSLRLTWAIETSVFATTALAAFIPYTYRYYYYQPTSVLEMAFFGLGLLAILTRTPWALLPIVAIGTFNRETMCFIPFAYFVFWLPKLRVKEWVWLVVSAVAWVLVFWGLRMLWPATKSLLDISHYISSNLRLTRGSLDVLVILSPAIIIVFNAKKIPAQYLRLALCSVPWVVLHFCTALWYEIRYYMPVLIWFLPGILVAFSEKYNDRDGEIFAKQTVKDEIC